MSHEFQTKQSKGTQSNQKANKKQFAFPIAKQKGSTNINKAKENPNGRRQRGLPLMLKPKPSEGEKGQEREPKGKKNH
jgi:hypothetical protein